MKTFIFLLILIAFLTLAISPLIYLSDKQTHQGIKICEENGFKGYYETSKDLQWIICVGQDEGLHYIPREDE